MREKNTDKSKTRKRTIVFDTMKLFFKTAYEIKPVVFVLQFFYIIVNTVWPFINVIFPKLVIDELTGGRDINKIILYTVLTLGLDFLCINLRNTLYHFIELHKDGIDRRFSEIKAKKAMEMDFEHTENPEVLDQFTKADEGLSGYSGGAVGILYKVGYIISDVIKLIGAGVLFIIGYPYLIFVLIISIILTAILNSKVNAINVESFKKMSKYNRAFHYIIFNLSDIKFGKDVRMYDAENMMLAKEKDYQHEQIGVWKKQAEDVFKCKRWIVIIDSLKDGFVYFILGLSAITKVITIGDFTMFLGLATTFNSSLQDIIYNVQDIYKRCCYGYEFVKFMNYPNAKAKGTKKIPIISTHTIELKNVSFKYPRAEDYVLENVSIKIQMGEHLSVVGLNGAGKTTFIKLICRLYDVTDGEILLDDVNIKDYDYDEYVKAISVVFQDFRLFAFSAGENIALCEDYNNSRINIENALQLSGMVDTVDALANGLDTYIFKQFEEKGTELSGGQQQKLAIARALYKNAPIVILDEPTAALDPMAEYEIYKHFNTLVADKTAIYISHRLSSCKFCDRIAVFSDRTIKEYGTHSELMKIDDGIYSEMFSAQSMYYT